jgi:GNAT superfamily N-acetyltransferase
MPDASTPLSLRLALDDGTPVLLRPVRPEDADLLRAGLDHLSADSRITRFFSPVTHLSDQQLAYLTNVDQEAHVAWGALDLSSDGDAGLGIARFARLPNEPHVAEVAITVVDAAQRHGLGSRLLAVLHCLARRRGITTFRAVLMAQNYALIRRVQAFGGTAHSSGSEVTLDLPVLTDADELPDTPEARDFRRVYREVAAAFAAALDDAALGESAPDGSTPRTTRTRPPAGDPS